MLAFDHSLANLTVRSHQILFLPGLKKRVQDVHWYLRMDFLAFRSYCIEISQRLRQLGSSWMLTLAVV